jgi:large subunit ribosomal protein L15
MPLQRRLPKVGFRSPRAGLTGELRLHELEKVEAPVIDVAALKAARLVGAKVERVKVIASGSLSKAVTLKGVAVTKGARAAIEAAGGKIED